MPTFQPPKILLLKIVAWLPLCFFIWYYFSSILLWPVYVISQAILTSLFPNAIELLQLMDIHIDVLTFFKSDWLAMQNSQEGDITLQINALKYSYGLPLLSAMTLATTGKYRSKAKLLTLGFIILIITQIWGVCFEILKTITFDVGAIINQRVDDLSTRDLTQFCMQMGEFGCHSTSRNIIALCYQFGYLILPGISPLLIWAYFNFNYLESISPNLQGFHQSDQRTSKKVRKKRKNNKRSRKKK